MDLGEPGGEELGEELLSDVQDLLALFLYFLFLFLFFFCDEERVWEAEDMESERLDSDCVHDLLSGMESIVYIV